jgi:hypothetical protein
VRRFSAAWSEAAAVSAFVVYWFSAVVLLFVTHSTPERMVKVSKAYVTVCVLTAGAIHMPPDWYARFTSVAFWSAAGMWFSRRVELLWSEFESLQKPKPKPWHADHDGAPLSLSG